MDMKIREKKVFLTGKVSKSGVLKVKMLINDIGTNLDIEKILEGYYAVTNYRTGETTIRQATQPINE